MRLGGCPTGTSVRATASSSGVGEALGTYLTNVEGAIANLGALRAEGALAS